MENNYILIECKPGYIKPDSVLKSIIDDTGLVLEFDFKILINEYGVWKFTLLNKEELFLKYYDILIERLNHAYYSGVIRYLHYSSKVK